MTSGPILRIEKGAGRLDLSICLPILEMERPEFISRFSGLFSSAFFRRNACLFWRCSKSP